ncbi:hypothetical protein [Nocardia pseudovaccinii]|uniref:hypothetical protein n=1 Tax=Nocardia pseudovaccinii TaxID=189540 RepID=UPI000B14A763|nr:hypothetical protein [Nocardia pseudovaccinii]
MPTINRIIVTHTTSDVSDANTDAVFELEIERRNGQVWELLKNPDFPNLPYNEREKGRTDKYSFDFSNDPINWTSQTDMRIKMRMISSNDAWLPKSIFVIGITSLGSTPPAIVLGAHLSWPSTDWFDRGSNAVGPPGRKISGFSGFS